jgi:PKD repeat protein
MALFEFKRKSGVRSRRRTRRLELLENRRLMIAEGTPESFSVTTDVAGLAGQVSGVWAWGNGQTTPAVVNANAQSGNVKIKIDYSLDSNRFFQDHPDRQRILQAAADALTSRMGDTLTAIQKQSPFVTWTPQISHPSQGPSNSTLGTLINLPSNPIVNAGEIVIYAGARPLDGPTVGAAGPGSVSFATSAYTFSSPTERKQIEDLIEADRVAVFSRGQSGALLPAPTDTSLSFGSITFDSSEANYHYGSPDAIQSNQIDFYAVASHELAHILGYGLKYIGATSPWDRLVSGNTFTGANAVAAYAGPGNVPLNSDSSHWADSVRDVTNQDTILTSGIKRGRAGAISPLDLAALKDIGWQVGTSQITVTGSHVYADDGVFTPKLILSGSQGGRREIPQSAITVTNVAPTLAVVGNQSVIAGTPLQITNLGTIEDPGFRNASASPATDETFNVVIDWGDGTASTILNATIDQVGNATQKTRASFDGQHTYTSAGNRTVRVTVTDDNGGAVTQTLQVTVSASPELEVSLSKSQWAENAGSGAADLIIRRLGSLAEALTVQLTSSDTSEASLLASIVIAANQNEVRVPISAIDDTLLDGNQNVVFTASAAGLTSKTANTVVTDYETLTANVGSGTLLESSASGLAFSIVRSNTDVSAALDFTLAGGNTAQATIGGNNQILAQQQSVSRQIVAANDSASEPIDKLTYTLTAAGYVSTTFDIFILDDEKPAYQNPTNRFDTDGISDVTPLDALFVINFLRRSGGKSGFNPGTNPPQLKNLVDVDGDNQVTPLDALSVINFLRRQRRGETVAAGNSSSRIVRQDLALTSWAADQALSQIETKKFDPLTS